MGPDGFQEDDVYLRTAISVDARGLGALRLREDARLPLGHLPRRPGDGPDASASATTWASRSGRRCPASTATRCAASSSRRATPSRRASSSSACSATPPELYDLRNLFQVNVEEGRHLWAMVYLLHTLLRPRRPRGGGGAARSAARATRTSRASSAPSTSRSTTGSRSSCSRCSPTATASTSSLALAESGFDPLVAHHALHAHRGGAPHVRRRDRACSASSSARRADAEQQVEHADDVRKLGRHRPADDPEVPEPLVLALASTSSAARSRRNAAHLLRGRPQGPRQGGAAIEDHRALERHLRDATSRRTARSSREDVPLRNAMNEVLRDAYVEDCQRGVDKWNKRHRGARHLVRADAPEPPVPPAHRDLRRHLRPIPRAT